MVEEKGKLTPRPFARLLTMIGDQLIKNEKIAIIELIKNSYDADADWVRVSFQNFEEDGGDLKSNADSYIEIEDDGEGMTFQIIQDSWMNPAAPNKYLQKEKGKNLTRKKRRVIQGEKGIGRYALYKLGTNIELTTRSSEAPDSEIVLRNDLANFDPEVIYKVDDKDEKPWYLDEIKFSYVIRNPERIIKNDIIIGDRKFLRKPQGTILTIRNLKSSWNIGKLQEIVSDISKLNVPLEPQSSSNFLCEFRLNGNALLPEHTLKSELELLFERAPIRVTEGEFDKNSRSFTFYLNGRKHELSLERMKGNKEFRNHFCHPGTNEIRRKPECGSFRFQFFVFDLTSKAPPKYELNQSQSDTVKNNRIYLYRDEIRVYPYGDPSDDWLGIDILRGTGRAGDYLSNDQVMGYVYITRSGNALLKDKTNREGLLEIGNVFADFRILIQSFLGFLHTEYKKYKSSLAEKKTIYSINESELEREFNDLITHLNNSKDPKGQHLAEILLRHYQAERDYFIERAETSEDLAAVGLTVEAASHDLMLMMTRAMKTLNHVLQLIQAEDYDSLKLNDHLTKLKGQLEFISDNIEGIQPLFRSSKRGIRNLDVRQAILDVRKYYDDLLRNNDIKFNTEQIGSPLKVSTTEAVLLQTFINLLDNSVYWLNTVDRKGKEIRVIINSKKEEVSFSDNGPGVDTDDIPYIFEPFFTRKGLKGRGLGLYIAKQLLERNDFNINYSEDRKVLSGANFVVSFKKKG
jgi:signal transduction histidine kinase